MTTELIQLTNQPKTVADVATVIKDDPNAVSGTRVIMDGIPCYYILYEAFHALLHGNEPCQHSSLKNLEHEPQGPQSQTNNG